MEGWLGLSAVALIALCPVAVRAQGSVDYLVRVEDPASKLYHVEALLSATEDTLLVSLPAWTPGHYELENYARNVRHFVVSAGGGNALRWDKVDPDTWRIISLDAEQVRIAFDFLADSVSLSGSLLTSDFGYFNGTNFFVYPEGIHDFSARVRFELPEGWRVATELADGDEHGVYVANDYHELVDNPTFIGHFGIDSVMVDSRWIRMAVYPESYFERGRSRAREMAMAALAEIASASHDLFGEPPYDRYTVFVYLEEGQITYAGGLEHANSHLDVMPAAIFEHPVYTFRQFFYRLLSHEYYHAWNVKRIRPAALWPYEYDRQQYTPLLWVSEGITDYYAHLILTRSGLWGENEFLLAVREWIISVEGQPVQEAVEDASLNTWIDPTFVDRYLYYDKGALLGLLLDIMIRAATEDRRSLDDVMRTLYREHYLRGDGFTTDDFLSHLGEHIGEETAAAFFRDYIDGRKPLPYKETLALAALEFRVDTIVEPFFGVQVARGRDGRSVVRQVVPGSAAAQAGLRLRDHLKWVGTVKVDDENWGDAFKRTYADSASQSLTVVFERDDREIARQVTVRTKTRYEYSLSADAEAGSALRERRRRMLEGG
jgi:predicted metalloprotease with PDZ domain